MKTTKIETLKWKDDQLVLLDQTRLPEQETYLGIQSLDELIVAIQSLCVRGAPAIGISAAYGMVLAARSITSIQPKTLYMDRLRHLAKQLMAARPTAVNLQWSVKWILSDLECHSQLPIEDVPDHILSTARYLHQDDRDRCDQIARHGQAILPEKARILTHCNTGYLATTGIGTALGVVIHAHTKGQVQQVYADETRPLLQGARLTAWECQKLGIPCNVICDNMAAALMKKGEVDVVLVGADRIASDGAAANKIGTYGLAILADHHQVPFYVVAPFSTFDSNLAHGDLIPIEMRHPEEVGVIMGTLPVTPHEGSCWNPAFDVTPPELIHGIITERGILRPPYQSSIAQHAADPLTSKPNTPPIH